MTIIETPQQLHEAFCAGTRSTPNYRVWERAYADFLDKGYTCADLTMVLAHIQRENKRMNGAAYSLRQNKLFDFEYMHFDSLLNEAKDKARNRRPLPTAKQQVEQLRERVIDKEESSTMRLTPGCHISDVLKTLGNQ
jgi:hypothetical protein